MRIRVLLHGLMFTAIFAAAMRSAQNPSFDIASIKVNRLGSQGGPPRVATGGNRFTASNATLRSLLQFAYRTAEGRPLRFAEILGLPEWADTDRFDVEAKASEDGRASTREVIERMVQSLLTDRFQLKAHWSKRDGVDIYNLVVDKSGHKLKISDDQTPPLPAPGAIATPSQLPPRGQITQFANPSPGGILLTISGAAIPISPDLLAILGSYASRPVIDKTNLVGLVDFRLRFVLDVTGAPMIPAQPPADPSGPTIFTAVREQLGLRLESAKSTIDLLVIDQVEKPTEN